VIDDAPRFGPPDDYEAPPSKPFVLHGKRLTTDEPWDETFSVLGEVPQTALVNLSNAVSISDGVMSYSQVATTRFLQAVIVPGDEVRFAELLGDKDRPMPLEQLGNVMLWAAGVASGRPTGPLPSSTDGQRDDADGSEDASPSPVTPAAG
jgi:hypothetical protein